MPGLRGALSVRINDGQTDRMVTQDCRGLKFTKVAPGGHKSISVHVDLPPSTFNDLGPADRIYVYDGRTAKTIIEGYLENPTPVDGPDGQAYDLSAVGGMALPNDETRPLIYVTRDMGGWIDDLISPAASTGVGEWGVGLQRVRTAFGGGSVLATGTAAQTTYTPFEAAGMDIGGYNFNSILSAKNDAGYTIDILTPAGIVVSGAMQLASVASSNYLALATRRLSVRLRRSGIAVNVADDLTATDWADWSAIGRRVDRSGTALTGAAQGSTTSVLASQVAEDLLGRLMTFCDPATAQIDATAFAITQLAYPDGVKSAGVLNDLAVFEPGYLWEILETLDNGKHRFNYRAWPTTPRYEVSLRDDYRQAGSDVDLCNRILVSWTDPAGKTQVTPVTAASLGLTGIGLPIDALGTRVKDADPITLPPGKGSAANATRIGGQILTDKINPPKAGTVLVRRPILDQLTGNMVAPWEIEPGYPCRIRETGDELRMTQADYDDDTVSMLLTLGNPMLTDEQRLARLDRAVQTVLVGV